MNLVLSNMLRALIAAQVAVLELHDDILSPALALRGLDKAVSEVKGQLEIVRKAMRQGVIDGIDNRPNKTIY